MTPPTDADLARWEALSAAGDRFDGSLAPGDITELVVDAVPALLAEVRRLRLMVSRSRTVPALRVRYPWTAEELRAADSVAAHARSLA